MFVYDKHSPESIQPIVDLLQEQVDVAARQIVIEALVIELNTDKLKRLGVQYGWADDSYKSNVLPNELSGDFPFSFIYGKNSVGGKREIWKIKYQVKICFCNTFELAKW